MAGRRRTGQQTKTCSTLAAVRQRDPARLGWGRAVIPAAVADSWLFWLAIIGVVAGVYILPTVIGIARQVEGPGLVICLNPIPVGWPAALILACQMPLRAHQPNATQGTSATLLSASGHSRRRGSAGKVAADGTAIAATYDLGVCCGA